MKIKKIFTAISAFIFLSMPFFTSATIITIDNTDFGFSATGFTSNSFASGFIGTDYTFDTVNVAGDNAIWDPSNLVNWLAGEWKVEMNWASGSNRAIAAMVTINSGLGLETMSVNQTIMGGQWNDLGTFHFDMTGAFVKIDDSNSSRGQYVIADAVRFTLITASPPEGPNLVSAPSTFLLAVAGLALLGLRRK
jgi:hypothetical protein